MADHFEKLKKKLYTHSKLILDIFIVGLKITAVIMFILMILGIYRIGEGIFLELGIWGHLNNSEGLLKILKGLEFIFISPLFYLLILSLTKYISATRPEIDPESLAIKKSFINHAMMEIMNVKTLSVSLFISILFLHSLGLILENTMDVRQILYIVALLIVLIFYYFILDKLVEKLRKMEA